MLHVTGCGFHEMIGKIRGTLSEVEGNIGLIETGNGVTYEVLLTPVILGKNQPGREIEIHTFLQIRDDAHVLFGFETKKEKELFKSLISISGVGPKTAFSIISFSNEEELISAVTDNNIDYFSKVPGLGKKTAMKIILELSQKLKQDFQLEKMYLSDSDKIVIDALVSLGFKSKDAKQLLSKMPKDLSIEEKIKQGLRLGAK